MTPPVQTTLLLARGSWCSDTIYKFNTHLKIMIKINREAESTGKSQMGLERNMPRHRDKMKVVFPDTWNPRCPYSFCRTSMPPCKASSALLAHLNISSKYSSLVLPLIVICSSWDLPVNDPFSSERTICNIFWCLFYPVISHYFLIYGTKSNVWDH